MNIDKIFETLQVDASIDNKNRYVVASIPELSHKIGCTEEGYPKFFVVVSKNSDILLKNINAELLSVEYDTLCNIIEGKKRINDQFFTIITLHSDSEQLQKTFIDVFLSMLRILPPEPTKIQLATKIESLLSIFAKLKKKPIHTLQGLWAEMLLIEQSLNPTVVANAWHSSPDSKYDFTMGEEKIEVKSTSCENRIHRFSLDQLNPSPNSKLLICSVIVRESGKAINGLSIYMLYDKICKKIHDDQVRLHIYDVMLDTLGSDFFSAKRKYFDYSSACDFLAFYKHTDVPKIEKSLISEFVSQVKFTADLSHIIDVREKELDEKKGELYKALF